MGLAQRIKKGLTNMIPPKKRIAEDDPRWNCRTMGNKRCGPRR